MSETAADPPRIPPRLVLASIVGLWACYFLLATLRGAVLGYEFNWAFFSRRLFVSIASMAVTAMLWPLLVAMARRPVWQRAGAVLVVGLPAALLLTLINSWAFAELDRQAEQRMESRGEVDILRDKNGSVVELGPGRLVVHDRDGSVVEIGKGGLVIHEGKDGAPPAAGKAPVPAPAGHKESKGFWEDNADMILGRYFLLLAWASIYLALANAEQARAAERREGEFRRAAQAAELRSLRYQVNPHFLFNTLNSLSALVLTGKLAAAERMIQTLSTFYRRSLAGDPTGDLPLTEEIELQKLYLEIEALRFPERLRTVFSVPEDLEDVLVPGMILQPLVENAVKYAVAVSKNPVTLTIAARAEGEQLVLSVTDDGPGSGQPQDGCGIGLANVRERLHARFGAAAALLAGALPQGGFRAEIRLPLQHQQG